jgi:3-hydroxyacyl-CoA dehydrogenase
MVNELCQRNRNLPTNDSNQGFEMPHNLDVSLADHLVTAETAARHVQRLMDNERRQAALECGADVRHHPAPVGIIGAGVMGTAIAAAAVRRGVSVVVVDKDEQAVASAPQRIASRLNSPPIGTDLPLEDVLRLVRTSRELAEAANCAFIVESVLEELAVKQQLLAQLEPLLTSDTIVASNTSTIPLAKLSASLRDPGRLCGSHFFLPVGQAAMVEVIRGEKTRPETLAAAVDFANAIDHLPLVVPDAPGFVVNRLLVPYLAEAMQLLTEGVTVEAVETAAETFGMLMGPLRLLDEIGLDTALECAWTMSGSSADLVVRSPLLVSMVKAKQLGRKTQAGFYVYEGGEQRPSRLNPALAKSLARWPQEPRPHTADTIVLRLLMPMIQEATRMLQRGSVRDAGQIDLAVMLGFGFPVSRGGLLYWADQLGVARIVQLLGTLDYLGPRALPTPRLVEMAQRGDTFYEGTK